MALEYPKVGQAYGARDSLSRYRVQVVQVETRLLDVGKRGVQLQNKHNGRRFWTSLRQLHRAYRRVP